MACILLWSSAVRVHDSQAYIRLLVSINRNLVQQMSWDGNLHGAEMSHAMTASPISFFRAPWRVGDTVVGRENAGWTTSESGRPCPCQNCSQWPLAGNTRYISAESSVMSYQRPDQSRDWTKLVCPKTTRLQQSINADIYLHPTAATKPSNIQTGNLHQKGVIKSQDQSAIQLTHLQTGIGLENTQKDFQAQCYVKNTDAKQLMAVIWNK